MAEQEKLHCRFFFDDKEVSEREYLRLKFCMCGDRNAPGRLMCKRCLKYWANIDATLKARRRG